MRSSEKSRSARSRCSMDVMHRSRFSVVLSLASLSCATTAHMTTADDAATVIRTKAAEAPDDIRRGMYLDELAKVELQRARQANTVLAYRRFLQEFPSG